jgi:hypothetical protein
MVAEAAKCQVLCANCHAIHHAEAFQGVAGHDVVEWRRRAKLKLVRRFGGRCVRCGFGAHVAALHFHHREGTTKEFAIGGDGIPRSWQRLLAEAAKCDLVCANCHREAHAARWK